MRSGAGVPPAVRGASRPRRNTPAGDAFAPACLTPCLIPVTCGAKALLSLRGAASCGSADPLTPRLLSMHDTADTGASLHHQWVALQRLARQPAVGYRGYGEYGSTFRQSQ